MLDAITFHVLGSVKRLYAQIYRRNFLNILNKVYEDLQKFTLGFYKRVIQGKLGSIKKVGKKLLPEND